MMLREKMKYLRRQQPALQVQRVEGSDALQLLLTPGGDRPIRLCAEVWDKDMQTPDDIIASATLTLDEVLTGKGATHTLRLKGAEADDDAGETDDDVQAFTFTYKLLHEPEEKQATKRPSLTGPSSAKAPRPVSAKAAPSPAKAAPAKGKGKK